MPNEAAQRDLKSVQDLAASQPAVKKSILWLELRHLEREQLLCESVQDLVQVEIFAGARTVVSTAFSLFLFTLVYSKLIELAAWIENARTVTIPLPPPIGRNAVLDLSGYIPSSTTIGWFAKLPAVSWQTTWKWVLVVVAVVALERLVTGYQTWRKSQRLRQTAEALREEVRVVRGWLEGER